MESLQHHSWRQYLPSDEYHQVLDPPHVTETGMTWAACADGGPHNLWATEPDPEGVPRCVQCLVAVGAAATERRARRIAELQSQTSAAFLALNTDGPKVRAASTRLDRPDPQSQRQITSEEEPVRRSDQGDSAIDMDPADTVTGDDQTADTPPQE